MIQDPEYYRHEKIYVDFVRENLRHWWPRFILQSPEIYRMLACSLPGYSWPSE